MKRKQLLTQAKPILFNTKMVQAILADRKTQTRRVIKNNPVECISKQVNGICKICDDKGGFYLPNEYIKKRSPYQIGDILYVRETWQPNPYGIVWPYFYKASPEQYDHAPDKWHPSIHMPKEAARIFLKVTNIRVEKIQDIDDDGVIAEGLNIGDPFDELWNITIKKSDLSLYGWYANPWVWVYEFERIS